MVELKPTDFTVRETSEIAAYVIRPPRPRPHAYQAPRLSRSSLRDLTGLSPYSAWPQRWFFGGAPHHAEDASSGPETGPVPQEVRVNSLAVRYRVGSARTGFKQQRAVAALAVALFAASVGVALGTLFSQLPEVQHRSQPAASLLIAGQNLHAKLAPIDASAAGTIQGLEAGSRAGNIVYVTQPGDDFTTVGARFGLRPRTVRLVNLLPLGTHLQPGQRLVITPTDGAYHRVRSGETLRELAERYRVSTDLLGSYNPQFSRSALKIDDLVFVPGATQTRAREVFVPRHRGYRSGGGWTNRLNVSRSLVGAFGSRVGELSWPASGQMSSPFGVRGFAFHPGVDICNVVGTPVRAAKGGVVQNAGWMGAYGYAVDIDHGGGVITRYAHCSRVLVSAGQSVDAGQQIARMGSTGRSTGPHLHFEVRIHGRAVNPAGFF